MGEQFKLSQKSCEMAASDHGVVVTEKILFVPRG